MGLECNDDVEGGDDGDSGNERKSFGSVSCSICLETVADNGDRSWAKLQCGHQFHLDCIGSAFNAKGAMQCPNCRKIEKGQWLYANGSRSLPEFSMDDWVHDEELYDVSYSEMSFGVHWCPFGSMARLPSSFEEGEFSSNTYHHDFLGQHAVFPEQSAVSSASQPCPYVAYIGPIHPSSSNSSGSVSDGYTFSSNWNPSTPTDIPSSYAFPATDVHYHSWEHHHSPVFSTTSNRIGAPDQPPVPSISHRAVRTVSDLPRSGSSIHPFVLSHSANARAGGSMAYPGSNVRSRERTQALQAYYQQHQPSSSPAVQSPPPPTISRRSSGHRGLAQVVPGATSSDHSGGFYFIPSNASTRSFPDPETPQLSTHFHIWERDHVPSFSLNQADRGDGGWSALHQSARGLDPGSRAGSLWQRHGLERTSSQNHRP